MRPSAGFTASQSNEHLRNWTDKGWNYAIEHGNYDRSRNHLNFEIANGKIQDVDKSRSIVHRIKEMLDARGIKDPNRGLEKPKFRTVTNFVFGGSRERMHEIAYGDQTVDLARGADNSRITRSADIEAWAMDVYRFVADKWGEHNIAAFVVHLDETTPHCHCTLLPINSQNKFAYKKIFCGKSIYEYKDNMVKMHDDYAQVVGEKWGLERGTSTTITGAKVRSTEEYRRYLTSQCNSLEQDIFNAQGVLRQMKFEISHAEKRVKGLSTMIANLECKREDLELEIDRVNADIRQGQGDVDALAKRLAKAETSYDAIVKSLADKRQKLAEANRKLAEFKALEEESADRIAELKLEEEAYQQGVKEASENYATALKHSIGDAAITEVARDLQKLLPALSKAEDVFADTLMYAIASHGENLLKCAALLLAGYVDGATTFAETCGGGGSPGTGWGRNDDEDENEFKQRCLFTAARMMRPAIGKRVKRK